MNPMIAGLAAASLLVGLVLIGDGLMARPRRSSTDRSTGLWTTVEKWWTSRSRSQRIQCVAGLVVGLLAFVATGWIVMLLAIPVIVVGLPALLGEPGNRDVEILEALDRWVRSLAASLPTGKSIIDAMRATAGQAPSLLQRPLRVMIARLDARWTTREALLALADDLDCPDADAVVAALVPGGGTRWGGGDRHPGGAGGQRADQTPCPARDRGRASQAAGRRPPGHPDQPRRPHPGGCHAARLLRPLQEPGRAGGPGGSGCLVLPVPAGDAPNDHSAAA